MSSANVGDDSNWVWKRLRSFRQKDDDPNEKSTKPKSKLRLLGRNKLSKSTYSIVPIGEVTEAAAEVWATLPDEIRRDQCLVSFREQHERLHGALWNFPFVIFTFIDLSRQCRLVVLELLFC